ncbi:MAG: hypothetical protein E7218_08650 [Anaerofustis stercorihominis]|nr:hypothetical protein [Anaerofustis stercorihominis]
MAKTYQEINEKIASGKAVVVDADEIISIVESEGYEKALEIVDVVTTATFSPMCSSGAFLNFGHATPPIRMEKIYLNNVECNGGLAAVDTFIGATQESTDKSYEYGGAHVICDLIDGKDVYLRATGKGTDCYPRKEVSTYVNIKDMNEAYLYNPRNCYQNYSAATNSSSKRIYTYMGVLQPNYGNVTYATSGQLSPLLNDPYLRTIGLGTRIFLAGAQGYVTWQGTQFNTARPRGENGVPLGGAATLAVTGDMKQMSTDFIRPAVFEKYGTSMFVGIGIPIPVLDMEMLKYLCVKDEDIYTSICDYSIKDGSDDFVAKVNYAQLRSGSVEINGKQVKTAPLSSRYKAKEIATVLKEQIEKGEFFLTEPVTYFPMNNSLNSLAIREKGGNK